MHLLAQDKFDEFFMLFDLECAARFNRLTRSEFIEVVKAAATQVGGESLAEEIVEAMAKRLITSSPRVTILPDPL